LLEANRDELLLSHTSDGHMAFLLAAKYNHVETLKRLWGQAKEMQLNLKELKKKLFLV